MVKILILMVYISVSGEHHSSDLNAYIGTEVSVLFTPDFFLEPIFDMYTAGNNLGIKLQSGVELINHFFLEIGIAWSTFFLPPGNFRLKGAEPEETVYFEMKYYQLIIDATLIWKKKLWTLVGISFGVGAGISRIIGTSETKELLSPCDVEQLDRCPHWRTVSTRELVFKPRLLPVFIAFIGVDFYLLESWILSLRGGVYNFPYIGMNLQYSLF